MNETIEYYTGRLRSLLDDYDRIRREVAELKKPATVVESGQYLRLPRQRVLGKVAERLHIKFDEEIFDTIEQLYNKQLRSKGSGSSLDRRNFPYVALLGTSVDGIVKFMAPIKADSGGCWNMPDIRPEEFYDAAVDLANKGASITGLVRIGKFNINDSTRGPSLRELGRRDKGFYIVSAGLDGFSVQTYRILEYDVRVLIHSYEVVPNPEWRSRRINNEEAHARRVVSARKRSRSIKIKRLQSQLSQLQQMRGEIQARIDELRKKEDEALGEFNEYLKREGV